jgi:hypothetical protein
MCAESSREIPNAPDDDTPLVFNERSLVFGINVCPLFQEVDESMEHHSGCLLQLKVATPTQMPPCLSVAVGYPNDAVMATLDRNLTSKEI